MPLSKEEKTNRIAKLRERSDYSLPAPGVVLAKGAESPVQPNGAEGHISFPDQVELDIKDILEKKQNEGIIGWGTRCQEIRKQMNHTPQQAADAIGISRKTLQIEESKRDATDVDPFFLEVFSLLYCVSPYQLLGLEAPIIDPLRNVDDSISKYINAIISTLYKEDDPEKIAFLRVLVKIAALSDDAQSRLISFLKYNTKLFSKAFRMNILTMPIAEDNSGRCRMIERKYRWTPNSETESFHNLCVDTLRVLEHLEMRRSLRLKELAQLATLEGETAMKVRIVLSAIVEVAEYPRVDRTSNRDVEEGGSAPDSTEVEITETSKLS